MLHLYYAYFMFMLTSILTLLILHANAIFFTRFCSQLLIGLETWILVAFVMVDYVCACLICWTISRIVLDSYPHVLLIYSSALCLRLLVFSDCKKGGQIISAFIFILQWVILHQQCTIKLIILFVKLLTLFEK